MLVYGDPAEVVSPGEVLADLRARLEQVQALPPGIARHAALVTLLIRSGELAQGVLDAGFADGECDELSPLGEACLELPWGIARALWPADASGGASPAPLPWAPLKGLERQALPARVTLKTPEGYAFYALYPEAYFHAARAMRLPTPPRIVGIRSIGTSLACVVAAATGAKAPVTVRPQGHPFQRTLRLGPSLQSRLLEGAPERHFAIVDEGPGLSGSSFGAVADFLESGGIAAERLHFFPSHPGPLGPAASERHRERWARAHRHTSDFDELFVWPAAGGSPLAEWVEDLTGPRLAPLESLGGGEWRRQAFPDERDWPAAHVQQERRKYLLRTERSTFLLKFAGLGLHGERQRERALRLSAAGLVPPVEGLRHGFLVQRWLAEAEPLPRARGVDRRRLLERVGAYLGFRARHLSVSSPGRGASLERLLEMARYNVAQVLGESCAGRLEPWAAQLPRLAAEHHPVETDNKMHAWEWLVLPDGRLLKADATDHCEAHDLVGCQDIAWDVAGATVELGLTSVEQALLAEHVRNVSGRAVSTRLLDFYLPCYLAFQLGYHTLAASALTALVPPEAKRLRRAARHYAARLTRQLTRR